MPPFASVLENELPPTHTLLIAKHPLEMLNPTLLVDVACAEMFRPAKVVVPKPSVEMESKLLVDEPTANPMMSPA